MPPGGLPKPGKLVVNLPDDHLQYALTWFALALGLAGVYVTWLARRLRFYGHSPALTSRRVTNLHIDSRAPAG